MSGKCLVIQPNGAQEAHLWEKSGPPHLEFLQKLVGGYIERVKVRWKNRKRDAYVNENGFIYALPYNFYGSELTVHKQDIVGPLVIWIPDAKVNWNATRQRRNQLNFEAIEESGKVSMEALAAELAHDREQWNLAVKDSAEQQKRIGELEAALREVRTVLQSDSVEYDDVRAIEGIIDKAIAGAAADRECIYGSDD